MDEVRRSAHILPQVGVCRFFKGRQRLQPPPVAVFSDQSVDLSVLPEALHAGGQDDEFSAVRHGHAGAVDGLVAQPCAFELRGIEIDHAFFQAVGDKINVLLPGQLHRFRQAFPALAEKEPVGADFPARGRGYGQRP